MTFDWKQKLKDGKEKAGAAFTQAVETGKKVVVKADAKLVELDNKMQDGVNKLATKVEQKVASLRKKKEEPKKDGPAA
jgi:lysophospholipid acyltransferase (LPLAT)-like uncharacterized protein